MYVHLFMHLITRIHMQTCLKKTLTVRVTGLKF